MKRIGIREAQAALSRTVREAQTDTVLLTRNGKPMAILHPVRSEDDVEDYLRESDPSFWKEIEARRKGGKLTGWW
jgi:prevent-host-death family protein